MTLITRCPGCHYPLSALTVYELWCGNCNRSFDRQDAEDRIERDAERLRDAETEPVEPPDADARADAYEKGFGW